MTSIHIQSLWFHEAIRARPGMYLGPSDSRSTERRYQARALLEDTVARLASPAFGNEATEVKLRVWDGPVFELFDDGRGSPTDLVEREGASLSRTDWAMTTLRIMTSPSAADYRVWGPLFEFGVILNALSSRVLLQTSDGQVHREGRYSRGGIIAPLRDSRHAPARGMRLVFELDPLLFDAQARADAHAGEVMERLTTSHPRLKVLSPHTNGPRSADPW